MDGNSAGDPGRFDYSDPPVSLGPDQMLPWESQAGQYPPLDEPGITYFRGDLEDGRWVDCLLHYDDDGRLSGILNHYPQAIPPYEKEGAVNLWVRPDRRRQGVGTALAAEALKRWEIYGEDQRLTPDAAAGFRHVHARWQGVSPDGVRYDRPKPAEE